MAKVKIKNQKHIQQLINEAYLGLGDTTTRKIRDILVGHEQDYEHPVFEFIDLMRNPANFYFTVKWLFGIELHPFQCVILRELWERKFPMLIGSRGLSKCITGDSWIVTDSGFKRIGDVVDSNISCAVLQGENGLNKVDYFWNNGITDNIRVKTRCGYELCGTKNHPIRVVRNHKVVWVNLEDIKLGDSVVISRSTEWFPNTNDLDDDVAYLFGLLVGDGGYTVRGNITITTADKYIIDRANEIAQKLWGKVFRKQHSSKYTYLLCGVDIWDELFQKWGFNSPVCGEKDFPSSVLSAKKTAVAAFIRGIMDTDGFARKKGDIASITSKSQNLMSTLQNVLLKFGIICNIAPRYNKKYERYYYTLNISGDSLKIFARDIGFGLQRKQDKLADVADRISNANVDLLPQELVLDNILRLREKYIGSNFDEKIKYTRFSAYKFKQYEPSYHTLGEFLDFTKRLSHTEEWQFLNTVYQNHYFYDRVTNISSSKDITYDVHLLENHSFISNGFISHNSFLIGLYAWLRCLFDQGSKVVLVGSGFRQSKIMFDYMEKMWRDSSILQNITGDGKKQGPKRDVDMCQFYIGDSHAIALPIGTGEKIRGLRGTHLCCDEFACLGHNSIVETEAGLIRISDFERAKDVGIYTGNVGIYQKASRFIKTPLTDVYEIETMGGYKFKCSSIHKVYTQNGFKLAKDLTSKDWLEFNNNYEFPDKYVEVDGVKLDENLAWLFGMLVAEGSINDRHHMNITMTDMDCVNRIIKAWNTFDNNIHVGVYTREACVDKRGWNNKESHICYVCNTKLRDIFEKMGLSRSTANGKKIPWSILMSPRSVVISFLSALFEGDGSCFLYSNKENDRCIGLAYYSVSEQLCEDVQILLKKLNIFSTKRSRVSKISKLPQWMIRLNGQYAYRLQELLQVPKWKDIVATAKYHNRDNLGACWNGSRNTYYVRKEIFGKLKTFGEFKEKDDAILYLHGINASLPQYIKVKRVTKLAEQEHLYDYEIPIYHSFYANGFRQHNSVNKDVFEIVIKGFAAVSQNPVDRVKDLAKISAMRELGLDQQAQRLEESLGFGNQTLISGTAYYAFNHFYEYWSKYKSIILTGGDERKLEEIFGGSIPDGFDWRDYSIIRIPYNLLPRGFLDDSTIAQSKAMVNTTTFLLEFGACVGPNTDIITNDGIKKITDICVGDMVLTHKGRFRPVVKTMNRPYNGEIRKIKTYGYNQDVLITPEHPFYYADDCWVPAEDVEDFTKLSTLQELNDTTSIRMSDICTNYSEMIVDGIKYIYPRWPSTKADFISKNAKKLYKSCVFDKINLDYDFGLVVGYYAAEGFTAAGGRYTGFALDGHVNTKCSSFVDELSEAIYKTFGIKPKYYFRGGDNTVNVAITSRVVAELMKHICPGVAHNKYVKPEILFSNPEFMRGFIVGYWNGDGHYRDKDKYAIAGSASKSLLSQVRLCLSYFGVTSTLLYENRSVTSSFNGRICNNRMFFSVRMQGENYRLFRHIFYHHDLELGLRKGKNNIFNNCFNILYNTTEQYDGYVYNLEVDEDNSYSIPNATIHNCWAHDSDGFFKRSLIERCVCKKPIQLPSGPVQFHAATVGNPNCRYIYGIDPASERDNFAIVVLEVHPDHRRIVYSWTINRQRLRDKLSEKLDDIGYYRYCAKKIRELMRIFPTSHIGLDSQGGGGAVMEALHTQLDEGEMPLWPYIRQGEKDPYWWEEPNKPTDGQPGLHILHVVNFANHQFRSDANHGLKQDFENLVTLFPYFDNAELGLAAEADRLGGDLYNTIEDNIMEIEELKDELATIIHEQTSTGKDHWDTPDTKVPGSKKGRMRKDRYSALLIANMLARITTHQLATPVYSTVGGYVGQNKKDVPAGQLYIGPQHIVGKMSGTYGMGVIRSR